MYNHPEVIDLLVRHVYQKSISEVLVRILNVSDNVFEECGFEGGNIDNIRQSFVFKIAQRMNQNFDKENNTQLNLADAYDFNNNATNLLAELVEYKVVY